MINYKKADLIPFLLGGKNYNIVQAKRGEFRDIEFPEDCLIDFDFRLVDIFKSLAEKEMGIKDKVKEQYFIIKEDLGHRPSRVELLTYMDEDIYENIKSKANINPFKDYIEFLHKNNELIEEEKVLYNSIGKEFINMIEKTSMSKTYKMPVLLAFYNNGNIKMKITEEDIYKSFYEFYNQGSNKVDMLKDKGTREFETWDKNKYLDLAKKNPIKFILKTHGDFFIEKEGYVLALREDLKETIKDDAFKTHIKDAIDLSVKTYYKHRFLENHN